MRRGLLAAVLASAVAGASAAAVDSQTPPDLMKALRKEFPPQDKPQEDRALTATKFQIAWADLNGDGQAEAIIYVSGPAWCGSGGCQLVVFERQGAALRLRGRMSVIRLPIAVLDHRTNGWRDLSAAVGGGGIDHHLVALPFDGERYVDNPTTPPARPIKAHQKTGIVIPDEIYPYL